ncbi:MAG: archease [Actinomycetota bacterium]
MTGTFEVLEHTADIGLRMRGATLEDVFEAAGEGLATLQGAWFPGEGEEEHVTVRAADRPALLVAWLDELLFISESRDVVFGGFDVHTVGEQDLDAGVRVAGRGDRELESVGVKAATYHRLRLEQQPDGAWVAEVYLDV